LIATLRALVAKPQLLWQSGAMSDDIRDEDYRTLAGFRYELRCFLHFSEQAVEAVGLTMQQHQALLAIRASPDEGLLVGEIAERLLLKPHSATGLVDRLAKLDLVRREHDPEDRRRVSIRLSEKASALLASLSAMHRAELRRIRPLLMDLMGRL
jgi:DNA-binding MarR family transcriptional regulator